MDVALLSAFGFTLAMSFLVGLALREYYDAQQHIDYFGSVRTYTFIGMLGFALWQLEAQFAYAAGFASLGAFLTVYYWRKSAAGKPGMIGMLTALLTYLIGPLVLTTPAWFVLLFVVSVLFALNAKERIRTLSQSITQREVVTLATFLTLAGVILPLLPREIIGTYVPLSPYQIWLAVVVSAGISYASYLLRAFAFPNAGLLLGALLGGLYSSTATTFMVARSTRATGAPLEAAGALVAPSAMMYLRMIALLAIFDPVLARGIAPWFLLMALVSAGAAGLLWRRGVQPGLPRAAAARGQRNPLELPSAALFGVLLVAMASATRFVIERWHDLGLNALAIVAGVTDIEPFVISLVQMQVPLDAAHTLDALVIATATNDMLKAAIAVLFGPRAAALRAGLVLVAVGVLSLGYLAR